ncbi:Gfo/Idh/MocA family protein [Natronoarchaeum rubrum]|uniref:Gfo/Idh/MocA family protein n=1 Tax=Natronoarchaeum rubrum TaxID=755311 RepID=UPI0021116C22|nr:Gfo/Idh/MocA family oxidoreductase [Natronoarchaeum rubrum]
MTRIGFVGGGNIARTHAEALAPLDAELVAVADIDPAARDHFEREWDVRTYDDHARMLENESLDAALIGVPNDQHAECAVDVLDRGVHALVEKPLAHTLEDARRIADAAAESAATAMVGLTMVFKPTVQSTRSRIVDGEFGDVHDVDLRYVRRRGIPQLGSWFTDRSRSGGGALIDCGVHLLAVALYALGWPEIDEVSASTRAAFGTKAEYTYLDMWGGDPLPEPTFTVEDSARALIHTADGASIHLDCAWASNRETETWMQLLGDQQGVTLDVHEEDATIYGDDRGELTDTELHAPETNVFRAEWRYFLDVLAGERDHEINTIEHGLAIQRLIDAIYRSADDGGVEPDSAP